MKLTDEDRAAIEAYREERGTGPFVAADAVVVSSDNHVLLIRRSKPPGRGLLALPGGFVDPGETFLEAAKRELFEETGLALPSGVRPDLREESESLRDAPDRDPRARIVSVAYLFRLPHPTGLLSVSASDDAADARWFALTGITDADAFFADHFSILRDFKLVQ